MLEAVRDAVRAGALSSCHDVAEGGFLVAVAECCLAGGVGATLDLGPSDDPWCQLFGERPVGFVRLRPARRARRAGRASCRSTSSAPWAATRSSSTIAGETSRWALAELREAHAALGRFFP